jgi:CDP-diglyceride synthetase
MNKFNGIDFDNLVIVMMSLIILFAFSCMIVSDYMNYLSGKQTRELVMQAISKNMTIEQATQLPMNIK